MNDENFEIPISIKQNLIRLWQSTGVKDMKVDLAPLSARSIFKLKKFCETVEGLDVNIYAEFQRVGLNEITGWSRENKRHLKVYGWPEVGENILMSTVNLDKLMGGNVLREGESYEKTEEVYLSVKTKRGREFVKKLLGESYIEKYGTEVPSK